MRLPTYFISALGSIGDRIAVALMSALSEATDKQLQATGIMGPLMKRFGQHSLLDETTLSRQDLINHWGLSYQGALLTNFLRARIAEESYAFAVLVGSNPLHDCLAEHLTLSGTNVYYYLPDPSHHHRNLAFGRHDANKLTVLGGYPFAFERFRQLHIDYIEVGHPLKDMALKIEVSPAAFHLQPGNKIIGMVPAKNGEEWLQNWPKFALLVNKIRNENKSLQVAVSLPDDITRMQFQNSGSRDISLWEHLNDHGYLNDRGITFFKGIPLEVISLADVLVTTDSRCEGMFGLFQHKPVIIFNRKKKNEEDLLKYLSGIQNESLADLFQFDESLDPIVKRILGLLESDLDYGRQVAVLDRFTAPIKTNSIRNTVHLIINHTPGLRFQ